jgi:TolB-like protein
MKKIIISSITALAILTPAVATNLTLDLTPQKTKEQVRQVEYNPATELNNIARFVAEQLTLNKEIKSVSNVSVAIASFVDLENFKKTNKLGLMLSETLIHDMQIRGYKVIDYKTMDTVKINRKGDFTFSRNILELTRNHNIQYFLSGTISGFKNGLIVNARLIDVRSKYVISTAQAFIPTYIVRDLLSEYKSYDKVEYETVYVNPKIQPHTITLEAQ